MNPILKFTLFGLLLGCGIAGCKDSDSDAPVLPESRLTLNPGELSVPREGGEVKFTISTNRGWGMKKTGGAWFEWVREATGLASDSIVALNVQPNPEAGSRTATITVMAGTQVGELKVSQFGAQPEIVLPVSQKTVSCDGASFECVVNANTAIAGVSSDAWIQAEEMAAPTLLCSKIYKIKVEANTGQARNGKVSFSGEEGGNAELVIQQSAFEVKAWFTEEKMSVSGLQTEAFVTVKANVDWTAEIIPGESEPVWASFKGENSGKANLPVKLQFALEPNESGQPRKLTVMIHAGGKDIPLVLKQTIGGSKRGRDSLALVALYNSASEHGDQIWDLHKPMNSWKGVIINTAGSVKGLKLESWKFKGDLPEEIGYLTEMTEWAFNKCVINGKLPESINDLEELASLQITMTIGKLILPAMDKLKWLNSLKFSGLMGWNAGYMTVLTYLDIENIEAIGGLSGLNFLDVSATSLTAFPQAMFNLEFIKSIDASYSKMATLPAELGGMKFLKTLIINNAELQGEIPEELFYAPELTTVELDNNKLSGELKKTMFTSLSMRSLSLTNNNLTGNVPVELSTVSQITTISVRNNLLGNRMKTLKIPEEIVSDSRFTGTAAPGGEGGQGQVKPSWFGMTNICVQRDGYGWSNCPTE